MYGRTRRSEEGATVHRTGFHIIDTTRHHNTETCSAATSAAFSGVPRPAAARRHLAQKQITHKHRQGLAGHAPRAVSTRAATSGGPHASRSRPHHIAAAGTAGGRLQSGGGQSGGEAVFAVAVRVVRLGGEQRVELCGDDPRT